MKINLIHISLFFLAVVALNSCGGLNSKHQELSSDSVAISYQTIVDTIDYSIDDKSKCHVMAEASIAYPDGYKDSETTAKLQKLFSDVVLDVPSDSVAFNESFSHFIQNILSQYGEDSDAIKYADESSEIIYKFNSTTNISALYNRDGFLVFCKEEVTKKNNATTMTSHYYYNFELDNLSKIELNNIIAESNVADVSDLLKKQLLVQRNVKNESELIDLGYFNLDNLVADNNFFITDSGISWNFGTFEIACYSVGETTITLDYATLKPYILPNSKVAKYIK